MSHGFYQEEEPGLPHPAISLSIFLVVEAALRAAWQMMRTNPSQNFQLRREDEDPVTCELCERLCNEVFNRGVVEGFDRILFSKPTRESKVKNFNGKNIDKIAPQGFIDKRNSCAGLALHRVQACAVWSFCWCPLLRQGHNPVRTWRLRVGDA